MIEHVGDGDGGERLVVAMVMEKEGRNGNGGAWVIWSLFHPAMSWDWTIKRQTESFRCYFGVSQTFWIWANQIWTSEWFPFRSKQTTPKAIRKLLQICRRTKWRSTHSDQMVGETLNKKLFQLSWSWRILWSLEHILNHWKKRCKILFYIFKLRQIFYVIIWFEEHELSTFVLLWICVVKIFLHY